MINLNLNQTLSWTKSRSGKDAAAASELAMLNDLQGNIVKGHGRHYTSNLFVNFAPAKAAQGKQFLASVGVQLTDALLDILPSLSLAAAACAERKGIPTAPRDDLRGRFGGFLFHRAA